MTPDTKDWTWVLHTTCPECGFDGRAISHDDVPAMLRDNAASWAALLTADGDIHDTHDTHGTGDIRGRPRPDRWSPLEYACHVRDVCRIYEERLTLMLTEDEPGFPDWDQDAAAVEERYAEQDPSRVATELIEAAETLATHFERVSGEQWQRAGSRSDGAHFTVDSFARYFIHDPVHHWHDITAGHRS